MCCESSDGWDAVATPLGAGGTHRATSHGAGGTHRATSARDAVVTPLAVFRHVAIRPTADILL